MGGAHTRPPRSGLARGTDSPTLGHPTLDDFHRLAQAVTHRRGRSVSPAGAQSDTVSTSPPTSSPTKTVQTMAQRTPTTPRTSQEDR